MTNADAPASTAEERLKLGIHYANRADTAADIARAVPGLVAAVLVGSIVFRSPLNLTLLSGAVLVFATAAIAFTYLSFRMQKVIALRRRDAAFAGGLAHIKEVEAAAPWRDRFDLLTLAALGVAAIFWIAHAIKPWC
jgi:hypothetical protein